jgi:C4-dicarboxylate transporter, DctM subunit
MGIVAPAVFLLLLLGVPIGIALSGSALAYILVDPLLDANVVFSAFFSFISKYTLMAIPLFIFAGFLMERTGLVGLLFGFADALVGWLPGGFGIATILACVLFAAISGSSVAMAAAMSVIAIPEMLKRGYPPWIAAGLVATSGGIAILIPPSIPLILFGIVTDTSVVDLFFAGVIPGLLLALANVVAIVWLAHRYKLARGTFDASKLWPATVAALPAFGMPVVILGGLYGGVFTPTEAAAAACGYALVYGLVRRRAAFLRDLLPVLKRSLNLSAVIFFLVGCVGVFQFLAANLYWPQTVTKTVSSWGLSPLGFIFAFIALEMVLGCFVDGVAMILLTIPVIYPVADALHIDLIHLGIMMTLTVEMSLVTPPVGLNLFAVSGVSKIPVAQVVKGSVPFFCTDALVLLAVVFLPSLATWIPSLMVHSAFTR